MAYRKQKPWGQNKPTAVASVDYSHPISNGLNVCWLFTEASATIRDIAVKKLNGTATLTAVESGKFGKAIAFNSANPSNITTASYACTGDFTFSVWVYLKADGAPNYSNIILVNASPYRQIYVTNTNHFLSFYNANSGGYFTSVAVTLNKWQYLVFTLKGTTCTFYLDGVNVDSRTVTVTDATAALNVGGFPTIGNSNARLDVMRIYNRALTSYEVKSLFTEPFLGILNSYVKMRSSPVSSNNPFSPRAPYIKGASSTKGVLSTKF